VILILIYFNQK